MSGSFGHVLPLRSSPAVTELAAVSQNLQGRDIPSSDLYRLPPLQTRSPSFSPDISSFQEQMPGRPSHRRETSRTDPGRSASGQEKLPSIAELLSSPLNQFPVQYQRGSSLSVPASTPDVRHSNQGTISRTHRHTISASDVISRSGNSYAEGQHHSTQKLPPLSEIVGISSDGVRPVAIPEVKHERLSKEPSPIYQPQWKEGNTLAGAQRPIILPQVVDEQYIEGKGLCYIYADGTYCPTSIDGEPVNASWGVTKAGKPRKRLAQACVTCREKKIKCQPNLPKCDQCRKSGRECRFESAPRGHQARHSGYENIRQKAAHMRSSLPPTPSSPQDHGAMNSMRRPSLSSATVGNSQYSIFERQHAISPSIESPADSQHNRKRRRRGSGEHFPGESVDSLRTDADSAGSMSLDRSDVSPDSVEMNPHNANFRHWATDPFETEPETAFHCLDLYLQCVNDRLLHLMPKEPFWRWAKLSRPKSLDDKMLLYSMLAIGSMFSDRPDRDNVGERFSAIARFAVDQSQHRLTLQLAQSRLILSLWYSAIGALDTAWDFIRAAATAVCSLGYNSETSGIAVNASADTEYNLQPHTLAECRRRTFWAVFILDRFSTLYFIAPSNLPSDNVFLRLPCAEDAYELQHVPTMPIFQGHMADRTLSQFDKSSFGMMAFVVEAAAFWGETSSTLLQSVHTPIDPYTTWYQRYYEAVVKQGVGWLETLPDHLAEGVENLESAFRLGKAASFVTIHILYHATLMMLNRHVRRCSVPDDIVERQVAQARNHATAILQLGTLVSRLDARWSLSATPNLQLTLLLPFLSCAILLAADVVSGFGRVDEIENCLSYLNGGLEFVDSISQYWRVARPLGRLLRLRINTLSGFIKHVQQSRQRPKMYYIDGPSLASYVYSEAARLGFGIGDIARDFPLYGQLAAFALRHLGGRTDGVVAISETAEK